MIYKSKAKSKILGGIVPSQTAQIEFEESCSICDRFIPEGKAVLRHSETKNILCLICLSDIAMINE